MLGIGWDIRDGYGWGVFGLHLLLELLKHPSLSPVTLGQVSINDLEAHELQSVMRWAKRFQKPPPGRLNFPVLHALGAGLAGPPRSHRGQPDLGMVFLCDSHLSQPDAQRNLRAFDGFLAGCDWNRELLEAAGAPYVRAAPQGVNTTVFAPRPRSGRFGEHFVVYSGGKLEFRKGQDLVLAAFRAFHTRHPDARLVTTWQSPWPSLAQTLAVSPLLKTTPGLSEEGTIDLDQWLFREGLPVGSFVNLGKYPNRKMAELLCECDVALLPSRAEGGTNLVAMEALASGLPVILSNNTGHKDLIRSVPCQVLKRQDPVNVPGLGTEGWGSSHVEEMVEALEQVYTNRATHREQGLAASKVMASDWNWSKRIGELTKAVESHPMGAGAAA